MPLPVIADVFRVTFNWHPDSGITPRNVIHIGCPSGTEAEVGAAVVAALQDHQFEGLSAAHVLDSVTVLKLDGSTAGLDVAGGGYNSGSGSGDTIPASAIVVSFQTGHRGSRGRGRIYIGPVLEVVNTAGEIGSGTSDEIRTAWEDFQTALEAGSPACTQVVASYVHADANAVANYRCDTILGTQRRRQDQLR